MTTTQGARAARETGMAKVEWTESARYGQKVHEVAEVAGVRLATIRTYDDDHGVRFWWCATARAPGSTVEVADSGFGASLDEVRAAAVERASWLAWALSTVMATKPCAWCGEVTSVADLTQDDLCERCVAACTCATCGADVEPDDGDDDETLCGDCVDEAREDDDGDQCGACAGTGIGQHGDPDESRCRCTTGRHYDADAAADAAYDRWRDRDFA